MRQSALLRLAALPLLVACADAPTTAPTAATPASAHSAVTAGDPDDRLVEVTRALLERAADGLLYTSESDYPFVYYFRTGPAPTPLTVDFFRAALGVPPETAVEEISLDAFFARHIERVDPADSAAVALVPRYVRLRETIRHAVRDPRVFRVGRIAIDCYVVGTDLAGNIVGLTTVAIET